MSEIITKQRVTTFLAHLLCISILFILPEVLTSLSSPAHHFKLWVYAKAFVFIAVFYIEYYWIIEHSLDKPRRVLRFTLYNLALLITALVVIYLIWRFKGYLGGKPHKMTNNLSAEGIYIARWVSVMSRDLVILILVIGFATALRLGDKWLMLDRKQKDLISAQREEELKNLKNQLNPHFLFNTLNSIYALIAISPEKAQGAVHELSKLLRYVLYDSPSTVTVRQEFDFIANYINLMKLRLNPDITLNVTLDPANCADKQIPSLLFITLIENVFKHGIHTPATPLTISITATDNNLTCTTSNGVTAKEMNRDDGGGIGMANLRRRLHLLYGNTATLTTNITPDLYTVTLSIPFK